MSRHLVFRPVTTVSDALQIAQNSQLVSFEIWSIKESDYISAPVQSIVSWAESQKISRVSEGQSLDLEPVSLFAVLDMNWSNFRFQERLEALGFPASDPDNDDLPLHGFGEIGTGKWQ